MVPQQKRTQTTNQFAKPASKINTDQYSSLHLTNTGSLTIKPLHDADNSGGRATALESGPGRGCLPTFLQPGGLASIIRAVPELEFNKTEIEIFVLWAESHSFAQSSEIPSWFR